MGVLSVVKREAQRTVGVALYLFSCFVIFMTLNKLFLASYQIEAIVIVPAAIGALALAKVVVLLDLTPVVTYLDTRYPVWVATLYKTLFYCVVSTPVLIAERVWHFYREMGVVGEAIVEVWEHMDPNRVLAKVIVVGLVFGCYHLYHGIDRRLGPDTLRHIILSRG